jgi:hypothetical protein
MVLGLDMKNIRSIKESIMRAAIVICVLFMTTGLCGAGVSNFDDVTLSPNSYWNGSDGSGGFVSGAASYSNSFTDWGGGFTSWDGWSYSNMHDTTTPGFANQYSSITGSAQSGSNCGIAYVGWATPPTVTFSAPTVVEQVYVTNTTYVYLSMLDGDSFAKQFGGASGNDPDWFMLTITGKDAAGSVTGTVDFYLADYRFADNSQDYLVSTWTSVDLGSLGIVKSLEFTLTSSDNSYGSMNTPAYFAMDTLTTVPEPATLSLLAVAGIGVLSRRKRLCRSLAMVALGGTLLAGASATYAGPYAPAAGQAGSTAISKDDSSFVAWGTGWQDYVVGANCDSTWQTPEKALGKAAGGSYDICCLGNGGQITITFATAIQDGPGADFAIFENGITDTFLELAYVEVSADGLNFVRFPNYSLTASPVSAFGAVDPTDIVGLGSKYRQGYGESFDLADVGLSQVSYVRIVDIIGDAAHNNLDSDGHVIYDPTLTTGSGGFDLDAIGVINQVPEPATIGMLVAGCISLLVRRHRKRS